MLGFLLVPRSVPPVGDVVEPLAPVPLRVPGNEMVGTDTASGGGGEPAGYVAGGTVFGGGGPCG